MAEYSQANRPFKVETVLGRDVFMLEGFAGEEGVSTLFRYSLDLVSTDDSVDAKKLLRTPVTVTMVLEGDEERVIHGWISRFVQLGQSEGGELTSYRAEVVPWMWFLSLTSECKIFQNKDVLEIVEEVFKSQKYSDFNLKCVKTYPKREFCVQYRETHLNFVSRLLEEEGIFYFFEHSASKHVLTLADDNSAVTPCPAQKTARVAPQAGAWQEEDVVTGFEREHAAYAGKVTLRDYDHLQPSLKLESSLSGDGEGEIYDYPGMYTKPDDGERLARIQLEEQEQWQEVVRGESTCRAFQSGYKFDLKKHYRSDLNQSYKLISVQHAGRSPLSRDAGFSYHNSFVAIPSGVPFHPPRVTPKPVVQGSQTAVVVGKSGEDIWVDKHGRVKVQFHWDRDGKKDENSSCWVRVSSTWAGKSWGFIQIPRIGQEVIVDFLEGDPDLPIITGRVYNAEQVPPYDLPGNQTQSGVKSRSSKKGTGENFNEIRMEDLKGSEELYIHAEKDKTVMVENDRTETVGNDETITIGNNRTEEVGKDENIKIAENRTESVGSDESISVGGSRTESVGKNESISVSGDRSLSVDKSLTVTIGDDRKMDVGKDLAESVGGQHKESVGKEYVLQAKKIQLVAKDEISLKAGKATIVMKKNGDVTINGKKITIKGSGDVVLKGSKIAQN